MIAVGLDLSLTSTGYAVWGGAVGRIRTDLVRHKGMSAIQRRRHITNETSIMVDRAAWRGGGGGYDRTLVVVEKSHVGTPSMRTAIDLAMLHAVVLDWLGHCPFVSLAYCTPSTAKKHLAGKGGAKKPEMIAAAQRCGYQGAQTDEADAYGLAMLGHHLLGGQEHLTPHRASCLAAVEWVVPLPEEAPCP